MVNKEYMELVKYYFNNMYDTIDEPVDDYLDKIKRDTIACCKKKKQEPITEIDVTNFTRKELESMKKTYHIMKIGYFMMTIKKPNELFNIIIYEQVNKTSNGSPCNMQYKIRPPYDKRLWKQQWTTKFNNYIGTNISENELIDIIRTLQIIYKMPAFI
jgi:hypothetical protein